MNSPLSLSRQVTHCISVNLLLHVSPAWMTRLVNFPASFKALNHPKEHGTNDKKNSNPKPLRPRPIIKPPLLDSPQSRIVEKIASERPKAIVSVMEVVDLTLFQLQLPTFNGFRIESESFRAVFGPISFVARSCMGRSSVSVCSVSLIRPEGKNPLCGSQHRLLKDVWFLSARIPVLAASYSGFVKNFL